MCSRSLDDQLSAPAYEGEIFSLPLGPVDKVTSKPVAGGAGVGSGFSGFDVDCHGHSAVVFSG